MAKKDTFQAWFYHPEKGAKLHDTTDGKPPKGWYDSPAKAEKKRKQ